MFGATTFNYDVELPLDTSFTGRDLLRIRLRAGNFEPSTNSFAGAGPSNLSQLEVAFQEPSGADRFAINRLYYQVPIGDFTFTLGGRVEQDNMLAIIPSLYPAESILDLMSFAGAIGANNMTLGPGAGVWWQQHGLAISANYVAGNGVRWVPFIGQRWPLTSLTPDGRNRVRFQCRPHGEFCLPRSCVALHGCTSIGNGPG